MTTTDSETSPSRTSRKTALVLDLLGQSGGATLDEIARATGWKVHTTRAMLTGLRKKGHSIAREKVDGVSRYRATSG